MRVEEYLAVPYRLSAYSAIGDDGRWHRYAEYAELGCVIEADVATDAFDQIEQLRVRTILERLERGDEIPVPRPPLRTLTRQISAEREAAVTRPEGT